MLHSVTLWRSQLQGWIVDLADSGVYLAHWPCGARLPVAVNPVPDQPEWRGWGYSIRLDVLVETITAHRCPVKPSTTPQLADGHG